MSKYWAPLLGSPALAGAASLATAGQALAWVKYNKNQTICKIRQSGTFTCTVYCNDDQTAVSGGYDLGQYPDNITLWSSTFTDDNGRPNGWTIVADMVSTPAKRAKITVSVSCKLRR